MKRKITLGSWFGTMLYISAFTFGGGYAMLAMMKREFSDRRGWIGEDEILDLTSLAQSAPGAVAINGAVVFGYRLAGALGVLSGVLATVLPPFVILSQASVWYQALCRYPAVTWALHGMMAGTAAVVLTAFCEMVWGLWRDRKELQLVAAGVALAAITIFGCSPALLMLLCILTGAVQTLEAWRRERT